MKPMVVRHEIARPFGSKRQAAGFVLLLLILLVLPVGLEKSRLLSRSDLYSTVPERFGAFSYVHRQIFEEKSEIDILFLSTSTLWSAVDTPHVQRELSRALGRDANVVTFGSNWRGEDLSYFLMRDLLQRRKVKLVAFSMPLPSQLTNKPHLQSFSWMQCDDIAAVRKGLSRQNQVSLYAESVLGSPRHLLSLVRPNQLEESPVAATLGADYRPEKYGGDAVPAWKPNGPAAAAKSMIYSPETKDQFRFIHKPLNDYQGHFLRLLFDLLRQQQVPVIIVNTPESGGRPNDVVTERMYWPEVFGSDMSIIGIPKAMLFQGMSDAEIDRFFYGQYKDHLTLTGSQLFTETITPAILEIYAQKVQPPR